MKLKLLLIASLLLCLGLLTVNYVEFAHRGIARNLLTGEMWLQQPGWHATTPWTQVAQIDVRPARVEVTTAGHGFSAKLVQFDEQHWREFIAVEGFHYYWWYNRVSFNFGYNEEYRGMNDILRGYAYGSKQYPFIKILQEY